jgi:hypothetical protein
MPRMSTLVRMLGIAGVFGLAALALPLPTHAGGVHVSVGFGRPWPVIVQPAPVVVARPTVVYPAPVIAQAPVVVADPPEGYAPPAYGNLSLRRARAALQALWARLARCTLRAL